VLCVCVVLRQVFACTRLDIRVCFMCPCVCVSCLVLGRRVEGDGWRFVWCLSRTLPIQNRESGLVMVVVVVVVTTTCRGPSNGGSSWDLEHFSYPLPLRHLRVFGFWLCGKVRPVHPRKWVMS
jgi:hypothetical protein